MNAKRPTILVTDAGRGSAISIIRALGRKGWRVIAADTDAQSLGFRSRYAADTLLYPDPETHTCEVVDALYEGAQKKQVDLIIPVTDALILPLAQARQRFAEVCQLALPDDAGLAVVTNKRATLQLAEKLGVPIPQTILVHTVEEAAAAAQKLSWPAVLKPLASRVHHQAGGTRGFKVSYANSPAELVKKMESYAGHCPVLLQEYYAGVGQGVELLMNKGKPLAVFQHKRLSEVPVQGGASALRESVPLDPELYDYSLRLLGEIQWTGLAMVEFKVGAAGPKLMEINGRVWGSLPLAVHSGVDFPARLVDLYLGVTPPPVISNGAVGHSAYRADYKIGVRSRNFDLESTWILAVLYGKRRHAFLPMPSRREGLVAFLNLFNPRTKYDILSWDDPAPGWGEMGKVLRKQRAKLQNLKSNDEE
ncbi:MAG: ATP-grasp domain-containing protein [Caldilineaceae bacterium]